MIEALMIFAVENNWQPPPEILRRVIEVRKRTRKAKPRSGSGKKITA